MAEVSDLGEKLRWLQLALTPGIGPMTFWKLLRKTQGNVDAACALVENLVPLEVAEQELLNHERLGFQILLGKDPLFPPALKQIRDCPILLSFAGDITLLQKPCIALVGARNASLQGKIFAAKLAKDLGEQGWTVISGMARGIDSGAHEGSLETGTTAVLAGGLDVVYPPENQGLYKQLLEKGLLLSEMRTGTAIEPPLFPRRNRIIAGLSQGVVLIEAASQSGSLTTAHYALEYGREIFVVPGFPADPRSAGGNHLLKQGATLVESVEDILSVLAEFQPEEQPLPEPPEVLTDELPQSPKNEILQALTTLPISVEILFQSQSCSLPHLLHLLTELELDGAIQRHPNGDISLKPS